MKFKIELLRCKDCGNVALRLRSKSGSGLKITPHQCSDAWSIAGTFECSVNRKTFNQYVEVEEIDKISKISS